MLSRARSFRPPAPWPHPCSSTNCDAIRGLPQHFPAPGRSGDFVVSMNRARRAHLLALVSCAVAVLAAAPAEARMPAPKISVLSNRADLVSGGDALVRVTFPRGVEASRVGLKAGKRNVRRSLRRTSRTTL